MPQCLAGLLESSDCEVGRSANGSWTQAGTEDGGQRDAAHVARGGRLAAEGWNAAAFDAHSLDETIKALGGGTTTQTIGVTFFQTPDIAENGAVVPIGVTSSIPKTESIAILVEKNPNMLAAVFDLPPGTEPSLATRVKMAQTSNVYALVKADGRFYVASKEIKVTLGGCGG
jgi:sulfur-oxidizing protein SoxY